MFNIVLFQPEIPQNTGSIGRLCVSNDFTLHLIEPLGFSLEDKFLRRAGMDYWQYLDLKIYPNWEDFIAKNVGNFYFISTHGKKAYWDVDFKKGDYLIFGRESAGLTPEMYSKYENDLIQIPMIGKFHRSLNLANSVGIVAYECLRRNFK